MGKDFDIKSNAEVEPALEPLEKDKVVRVDQPCKGQQNDFQRLLALSSKPYPGERWFHPVKSEEGP